MMSEHPRSVVITVQTRFLESINYANLHSKKEFLSHIR